MYLRMIGLNSGRYWDRPFQNGMGPTCLCLDRRAGYFGNLTPLVEIYEISALTTADFIS